jgi:hypothetical protein
MPDMGMREKKICKLSFQLCRHACTPVVVVLHAEKGERERKRIISLKLGETR